VIGLGQAVGFVGRDAQRRAAPFKSVGGQWCAVDCDAAQDQAVFGMGIGDGLPQRIKRGRGKARAAYGMAVYQRQGLFGPMRLRHGDDGMAKIQRGQQCAHQPGAA